MEVRIKGLCIRNIDYKDNDSLITIASLERGKILATVRGSKKQTSRLRFSASLFCFADYILNQSNSGRYVVTGCDLIDSFLPLREDIDKFYLASIMLEILDKNLDMRAYIAGMEKSQPPDSPADLPPADILH